MERLYLLTYLSIFLNILPIPGQKVSNPTLFGEHAKYVKTLDKNVFRIFIDMNGDYYPENIISDSELENQGESQLKIWAQKFPTKFEVIAKDYNLNQTSYSENNFKILQDSIIQNISKIINENSKEFQTWLIHGYRKKLYNPDGIHDSTSVYDNRLVRERIDRYIANPKKNLTIEVYWDGKYEIFYSGLKSKIKLGRLFKNHAIPNANKCGYSLRQLFTRVDSNKTINIITHSTGTHVVTSLLFNKTLERNFDTPNQCIKVVLVASASSGKSLFRNYYKRSTNINFKKNDNYIIINFYNEKDNVLRKGGFPRWFGNTTLGCNFRNESIKLKKYFEKRFPNSLYFDSSTNEQPGGNHFFWRYTSSSEFSKILSVLY